MKRTAAKLLLFLSGAIFAGVVMPEHGEFLIFSIFSAPIF